MLLHHQSYSGICLPNLAMLPATRPSQSTDSAFKKTLLAIRDGLDEFLLNLQRYVALRVAIGIFVIVFMANLDALVDLIIHPELSYFDHRHLIVGGLTGLVTTVLFGMLSIYVASFKRAQKEIKTLEGLLPICSSCNKIRTTDNSWHLIEKYISERTEATFTHGLCPDCAKRLYPQMYENSSPT
jgi:hypothetical protein